LLVIEELTAKSSHTFNWTQLWKKTLRKKSWSFKYFDIFNSVKSSIEFNKFSWMHYNFLEEKWGCSQTFNYFIFSRL